MGGELKREYENRVKKALSGLREVYENQVISDKDEYKDKYEKKILTLKSLLSKQRSRNVSNSEEQQESERRMKALLLKAEKLTDYISDLKIKIRNLSDNIEEEKKTQNMQVCFYDHKYSISFNFLQILNKDEEIKKLLVDISAQLENYQNLQQTKTALDMEIAVYRKLLESEEDRLGLQKGEFCFTKS